MTLKVQIPTGTKTVTAVIMDLGFLFLLCLPSTAVTTLTNAKRVRYSTHGVHMNNRLVELRVTWDKKNSLVVTGPASRGLYPPGTFSQLALA
jgi:hypothetical protein